MVKLVPMLNHSGLYCQEMMEVAVAPLEICAVIDCLPPQTYQDSVFYTMDALPVTQSTASVGGQQMQPLRGDPNFL